MPVLTITGEYGVGNRLADSLKEEARNLTSVIVPGSGHFVAEEAPDVLCASLETFLAS
jgi:pimeloyl-ACP methyl ester carboxylesterase